MTTTVKLRPKSFFFVNVVNNLRYRIDIMIGRRIERIVGRYEGYQSAAARQDESRLSATGIEHVTAAMDQKIAGLSDQAIQRHAAAYDEMVANIDNDANAHRRSVCLRSCRDVIRRDGDIRTLLNIGCGEIDAVGYHLAKTHPEIGVTSLDFSPQVAAATRRCFGDADGLDNWHYRAGYPLDLLGTEKRGGDLVALCGLTSLLTNAEYRAYVALVAETARHVVVTDVWYPPLTGINIFKVVRPEDIDPRRSLLVSGLAGGAYLHNHVAILAESGFAVERAEILNDVQVSASHGDISKRDYVVNIVARNARSDVHRGGKGS